MLLRSERATCNSPRCPTAKHEENSGHTYEFTVTVFDANDNSDSATAEEDSDWHLAGLKTECIDGGWGWECGTVDPFQSHQRTTV